MIGSPSASCSSTGVPSSSFADVGAADCKLNPPIVLSFGVPRPLPRRSQKPGGDWRDSRTRNDCYLYRLRARPSLARLHHHAPLEWITTFPVLYPVAASLGPNISVRDSIFPPSPPPTGAEMPAIFTRGRK